MIHKYGSCLLILAYFQLSLPSHDCEYKLSCISQSLHMIRRARIQVCLMLWCGRVLGTLAGLVAAAVMWAALWAISIGSSTTRELWESEPEYDKRDIAVSTCLPVPLIKEQ